MLDKIVFMERREKLVIVLLAIFSSATLVFDIDLLFLINSLRPILDSFLLNFLIYSFYILPFLPLFYIKEKPEITINAYISSILSYTSGTLLKFLVNRPRPYEVLNVSLLNKWTELTPSYPSTTTALAFSLFLPLFLYGEKKYVNILSFILSSLIAFFVIYTGYHYPSDVAGGVLLSFFWVTLIHCVFQAFHLQKYLNSLLGKLLPHLKIQR